MTGEDIARAFDKLNNLNDEELANEWDLGTAGLFEEVRQWIDANYLALTQNEKHDCIELLTSGSFREFAYRIAGVIRLIEDLKAL